VPANAGCDGLANSGLSYDACGVCGGSATSCDTVAVRGLVSPDTSSCSTVTDDWRDCNRDPFGTCAEDGQSYDAPDCPAGEPPDEDMDADQACDCLFGAWRTDHGGFAQVALTGAEETGFTSEDGCAVFACMWSPCDSITLDPPPPACGIIGAEPNIVEGWDWSVDHTREPGRGGGFLAGSDDGDWPRSGESLELVWRAMNPNPAVFTMDEPIDITPSSSSSDMEIDSLRQQLDETGPVFLRTWTAGVDWAPDWLLDACPSAVVVDYKDMEYLPLWDECIWGHLTDAFRVALGTCREPHHPDCAFDEEGEPIEGWGLIAQEQVLMVWLPGGFSWAEYDFGVIRTAAEGRDGNEAQLELEAYTAWFEGAMKELVEIANGDPNDPSDDYAYKLTFTGEDFPALPDGWDRAEIGDPGDWSSPHWAPLRTSELGFGMRNGMPENYNDHRNHVPAWGRQVDAWGHAVSDPDFPAWFDDRAMVTENECLKACGLGDGYDEEEIEPHLYGMNFLSLTMGANWLYVSMPDDDDMPDDPGGSVMGWFPEHWDWVYANLGAEAYSAAEAWTVLRVSRDDEMDNKDDPHDWATRPWIRNWERFITQRDVCPGGWTQRGTEHVEGDMFDEGPDTNAAWNGRRTDSQQGQDFLYFQLDTAFGTTGEFDLYITYVDDGLAQWRAEYPTGTCLSHTASVTNTDSGELRTARFDLGGANFGDQLPGDSDLRIYSGGADDLEVRMLRLVRRSRN